MAGRDNGAGRGQGTVRAGLSLGSVGGIQVRVDWSAPVIFALIAVGLAAWQFPAANPRQAPLAYVLAGVLTTLVFLASRLAHELAHSLVARHYSHRVDRLVSRRSGHYRGPAGGAGRLQLDDMSNHN